MKMEDFSIVQADDGVEFIQYTEGPTKTRQGGEFLVSLSKTSNSTRPSDSCYFDNL